MFLFNDFFSDGFQLVTGDAPWTLVPSYVTGQLREFEDWNRRVVHMKGRMVVGENHDAFNPDPQWSKVWVAIDYLLDFEGVPFNLAAWAT